MIDNYIISKIDGRTYNRSNGHFTRHLKQHSLTYQEYYEVLRKKQAAVDAGYSFEFWVFENKNSYKVL